MYKEVQYRNPSEVFIPIFQNEVGLRTDFNDGDSFYILPFTVSPYEHRYEPDALVPALWIPPAEYQENIGFYEHLNLNRTLKNTLHDNDYFSPGPFIRSVGKIRKDKIVELRYNDSILDILNFAKRVTDDYGVRIVKVY